MEKTNRANSMEMGFMGLRCSQLLAFDADDTLWDNQSYFESVERDYCELLSPYGSAEDISASLFKTETANMPLLGYGCKAFTISLIENALSVSNGQISPNDIRRIVDLGKSLLSLPSTPLPGVVDTLRQIHSLHRYKLVVFTKGNMLDQQNKLERSGLAAWFDDVIVVADKTHREYKRLCTLFDTDISRMTMVGNSFKSDIAPVLQLGGYAVHIPFHVTWKLEETEEFDHHRLCRLQQITDMLRLL